MIAVLFWTILVLVIGFGVGILGPWLTRKNIKISWYEWLIGVIGLLLLLFTIQSYFGSKSENETYAANMFLLVTGLPGLILVGLAFTLAWRHKSISPIP